MRRINSDKAEVQCELMGPKRDERLTVHLRMELRVAVD